MLCFGFARHENDGPRAWDLVEIDIHKSMPFPFHAPVNIADPVRTLLEEWPVLGSHQIPCCLVPVGDFSCAQSLQNLSIDADFVRLEIPVTAMCPELTHAREFLRARGGKTDDFGATPNRRIGSRHLSHTDDSHQSSQA